MTDETETKPVRRAKPACDNHPSRQAVLNTDGGGAFQMIHLCRACIPENLRYLI